MDPLGPIKQHFWRVQKMLKHTGTDAAQAFAKGELSSEDWAAIVTKCRSCSEAERCDRSMDRNGPGAHRAPDYCLNADVFADLPRRRDGDM